MNPNMKHVIYVDIDWFGLSSHCEVGWRLGFSAESVPWLLRELGHKCEPNRLGETLVRCQHSSFCFNYAYYVQVERGAGGNILFTFS